MNELSLSSHGSLASHLVIRLEMLGDLFLQVVRVHPVLRLNLRCTKVVSKRQFSVSIRKVSLNLIKASHSEEIFQLALIILDLVDEVRLPLSITGHILENGHLETV